MKTKVLLRMSLVVSTALIFVSAGPPPASAAPAGSAAAGSVQAGPAPPAAISTADLMSGCLRDGGQGELEQFWESVFERDGGVRVRSADAGRPGRDAVPVHAELYGSRDAVFIADNIDPDSGLDTTALVPGDRQVDSAPVSPQDDLANAYVLVVPDPASNLVYFIGLERVSAEGTTYINIEFNRERVHLGAGRPWEIVGGRSDGDMLVHLDIVDGKVTLAEVRRWDGDSPSVSIAAGYHTVKTLAGEGCDGGSVCGFCVVSNSDFVQGGPWTDFNHTRPERSGPALRMAPHTLINLSLNVGWLMGPDAEFSSVVITTPGDIAFGYFGEHRQRGGGNHHE